MCDTVVLVPESGPVWLAKNSDREPSEAQFFECHDDSSRVSVPSGLPDVSADARLLLSRPAWMWGCEMGVNEHGLAIGNEAVFTRMPVPKAGYSGMDFQRAALSTCRSADDALEQLIELTERLPQGGGMGHRNRAFRYHSSFLIADAGGAWIFETAGEYWAAKRVRGVATISNALSIEDDFDRVHSGAYEQARKRRWLKSAKAFSFAGAFSDRFMSLMAGARIRRACTAASLAGLREPKVRDFILALSDHGAPSPGRGLRSESPCAHASWLPTRTSAQTTGSLIARLGASGPRVWATGTSSPCLSVFKPAPFDSAVLPPRPVDEARFDARELWWGHERLHRACLADYAARRVTFADEREQFQDECLHEDADAAQAWSTHRAYIEDWLGAARAVKPAKTSLSTRLFWSKQSRAVSIPA